MPRTIQSIVCAVDFSAFSSMVIARGIALAKAADARLFLIHGVNEPQDRLHPTAMFERGGDLGQRSDVAEGRLAVLMEGCAVPWEAVVRFGDPVEQTVQFVAERPHCLVVSASHGVSGIRRLFIGTVVERLTRLLPCPMLVVKPDDGRGDDGFAGFRRVVVSCDHRGRWRRWAPLVPLLQTGASPRLHLVQAMERPVDQEAAHEAGASYEQVQRALQGRTHQGLLEQGRRLFSHIVSPSVLVAPGVPQEMVLDVAGQQAADLIVVGVRRSGKVGRWLSGSTTEAILRHSACSVLTIPEQDNGKRDNGDAP